MASKCGEKSIENLEERMEEMWSRILQLEEEKQRLGERDSKRRR